MRLEPHHYHELISSYSDHVIYVSSQTSPEPDYILMRDLFEMIRQDVHLELIQTKEELKFKIADLVDRTNELEKATSLFESTKVWIQHQMLEMDHKGKELDGKIQDLEELRLTVGRINDRTELLEIAESNTTRENWK